MPAMISAKKMMPSTRGTTSRHFNTIHVTFRAIASPTRQAPKVTKIAIFFARLESRIAVLYQIILNETRAKKN